VSSVTTSTMTERVTLQHAKPRFFGLVSGEFFKVGRMWSTWITLVLLLGVICLPYLVSLTTNIPDRIHADALSFYYDEMQVNLSVLRVFIGFFLIILTASVFGREYQLGTIRILLARGVGRLQLLLAKLLTVVLIALSVLIIGLSLNVLLMVSLVSIKTGNLNSLQALTPDFWHNTSLYLLTVLISMGTTILMAMAMTALGRSLTFGLSAAMAWFPADNLVVIIMLLGYRLTHNDFWRNITAYFLGPNLNVMPKVILPVHLTQAVEANTIGMTPNVTVDGTHTLLVTLVYSLVFLVLSLYLTWKLDVKE